MLKHIKPVVRKPSGQSATSRKERVVKVAATREPLATSKNEKVTQWLIQFFASPTVKFCLLACQIIELLLIFTTLILTVMDSKTENAPSSAPRSLHPFLSTTEPSHFPPLPQTDGEHAKKVLLAVTIILDVVNLLRLGALTYIGGWKLLRKPNVSLEWFFGLLGAAIDCIEVYYIGESFSSKILLFVSLLSACFRIFLLQYEFTQVQTRKLKRHLGLGEKKEGECPCRCQCPHSTPVETSKESVVVQIEPLDEVQHLPSTTRTPRQWPTVREKVVLPDLVVPRNGHLPNSRESDAEKGVPPFCANCQRSKPSDTANSAFSDDCPELPRYAQWRLVSY